MYSAWHGHKEIVTLLIDAGAKVNLQDEEGWTSLMYASFLNNKEIVELLLDAGGDVHIKNDNGTTALFYATQKGYTEIVEVLENVDLYKLRKKLNVNDNTTLMNSNIF
jgi:ankyrin repeat protein